MGTIAGKTELAALRARARGEGKRIVFTNGVFDILHRGHVEYLAEAKKLGDILVVGLNSDSSVRRIKGERKPIVQEEDRASILAGLAAVDYVCLFDEDTPAALIDALLPDILVKGGDYAPAEIVGRETVEQNGGRVVTIPLTPSQSTTGIIERIIERYCG